MATHEAMNRPEIVPGERIFLSQVHHEDLPQLARWFSDIELTTYLGQMGFSFMPEHEQEWFENLVRDKSNRTFAIVVRESRRLIGTVSLMEIDFAHSKAELGIAIGDKGVWGQGYGSEAVRLMADYGLTFMNLHTIYLWHVAYNQRGHQAYLRAGFKLAGRLRGVEVFNGQRYDRILMDFTREDLGPSRVAALVTQATTQPHDE